MKNIFSLFAVPVLAFAVSAANAGDFEKPSNPVKDLIEAHMLETGFITQEDIDARIAEQEEVKAMIDALKEAGDEEAIQALREELRDARDEQHDIVEAYIADNADLSEEISALVSELRAERQANREERRAARGM